jgi:predicted nucleotidyltransferase
MKRERKLITDILHKHSHILFPYLFGSRPKGFANDRSDWDIALFFKEPLKRHSLWPAFELEAHLSRAIGAMVRIIVLNTPLPPVLGFQIVRDGILLIDREPKLRMDFENRILRQYHDWQYFLKRQMDAEREKVLRPSRNKEAPHRPSTSNTSVSALSPQTFNFSETAPHLPTLF